MLSDLINRLCGEIDSRFQELSNLEATDEEQPPPCLYHYTSAQGLLGIIQSGELWATNVLYLNDASELLDANEVLASELETEPVKLGDADASYMQKFIPGHSEGVPLDHFVVSFCETGDMLGQWRAYGAGNGYSIGFHSSALLAAAREEQNNLRGGCTLQKVKYQRNQKEEMIRKRIEILRTILEPVSNELKVKSDEDLQDVNRLWAEVAASMRPTLALMKHAAFSEEREWRLVRTLWKTAVPAENKPIRLRIIGEHLTPYIPLSWVPSNTPSTSEAQGIKEVRCGPAVNPELKEKAVRDLLISRNCWNTTVLQSKVPLRV